MSNRLPSPRDVIQQAGVVPLRRDGTQWQICLITSIKQGRWGLPKGIIDPGETSQQAALKEAYEEAGLLGQIVGPPIGQYRDRKWGRALCVTIWRMDVSRCDPHWPETELRQRRWFDTAAALTQIYRDEQRKLVAQAFRQLPALGGSGHSLRAEGS